jgi:ankyrin repeat protein
MEPIFEAALEDERALSKLLSKSPHLSRARAEKDYLVESIPHWIYVGDTPLHLASAGLRVNSAILLLESGAEANAQNRRGATALHYACDPRPGSGGVWNPERQGALIDLLIGHGGKIDHPDKGGATALHRAVRARSAPAVRRLLENGARVDVRLVKLGSMPLHLAVQSTGAGGTAGTAEEQLEIIELLLAHGASPDDRDRRGRTVTDWSASDRILAVLHAKNNGGQGGRRL